ncbi:ATP-dependent DNA helicase PcrA [Bacillus thuringiensis serovar israelensis]|nr:ATP-dependent DNA helicase PcrA [Bacillus thuringiensis serovar israelensis]EAO56545.1 ATP-dependent DNA helicase pcrA [Bacillus thuringiensis serovar israelensis ATCC 35646]EEN00086.1 ATP-dependent DNA helicase pcrA [Bacillus thuringiensis IBL 4222]KAA8487288.1 ATP-dependent helicase [Bacillus thuringiensis]KRD80973.1 ATP-dependent DNA helicase PcrA [Bacillus sp. Root11]KRD85503.1 ATP-dependent DNA helicase PcrA [Bacillus sp. Root131]OTX59651.1 ATP-dependent DNA helicase PcrA [Bacillus th
MGDNGEVGNTYESILNWLGKKGYNLDELGLIITEQKDQLIIAGAGSGKTTSIIFKLNADIKTGNAVHEVRHKDMTTQVADKIWVSTFLKSGAEDLQRTFMKQKNEMGISVGVETVKFSTLHAEFLHCLKELKVPVHIMDMKSTMGMIRDVAKNFGLGSRPGYPTNEEVSSIVSYISAARNRLNPDEFYHPDMEDVGLTRENIKYVIANYAQMRKDYKCMDFEDLQELLYKFACNPETRNPHVTNFISNRYDRIIIDEFQDVSEIQYEIFKVYAKGCKQVTVIGDDDQSIYSWRGSNIDIITKRFPADFKPVINKLSRNYRCPSNVLNPIINSITMNENRYEKPLKASREGGTLNCYSYGSTIEMARSIQEQIMEDVNNGMTVAILGRTNPSLLPLSVFLDFQDKFNYAIRGTLYDLKRPKFRKYWQLAYLFMNNYEKMHENLKVIAKDLSNYQLKNFVNALKIQGQTIFNFPMNSLRNISEDLASFVIHINSTADDEVEKLKATFEFVKYRALDANDEYTEETVSIIELLEMIIECGDVKTMDDFIYEINYRNTRLHSRADSRDTTIQLTTVHDFKGKEADSVYIWKDTNKLFPSSRSADTEFEEERRIHYIAGTRAKEKSTILTIRGSESPFIAEMGIVPVAYFGEGASGSIRQNANQIMDDEIAEFIYGTDQSVQSGGVDFEKILEEKKESQTKLEEEQLQKQREEEENNKKTNSAPALDFSSMFGNKPQ